MKKWSIKRVFFLILVLSGVIPSVISFIFLANQISSDQKRAERNLEILREQTTLSVKSHLKEIEHIINLLENTPEFIEYLRTPESYRKFIENRVYGKINHLIKNSTLKLEISYKNENGKLGIQVGAIKDQRKLTISRDILLDDQNMPSGKKVGSVIVNLEKTSFINKFSLVEDVILPNPSYPLKNIQIVFKNPEGSKGPVYFMSILSSLILLISAILGFILLKKHILNPIETLSSKFSNPNSTKRERNEINHLETITSSYIELVKTREEEKAEKEKNKALAKLSSQLAHDIRSPLTALEMATEDIETIPEEKRVILRTVLQRIKDIANNLLSKNNDQFSEKKDRELRSSLVYEIVESILSEKRYQFKDRPSLGFSLNIEKDAYSIFSKINDVEFKRVLSNLINNSVEAINQEKEGKISILVKDRGDKLEISIKDNGKGIDGEILRDLVDNPKSYKKDKGNGLGLKHAFETIGNFGGKINISSIPDEGTIVSVFLPKAKQPSYFVEELNLIGKETIVVLDDDSTIHEVWKKRFPGQKMVHCYDEDTFKKIVKTSKFEKTLFLMDLEIHGNRKEGLTLIKEFSLKKNAILVTSHFGSNELMKECLDHNIKIIPKSLANHISIKITTGIETVVHLEDDFLIQRAWKNSAENMGLDFLGFSDCNTLLDSLRDISKDSHFYLDLDINGDQEETFDLIENLNNLGYEEIYAASGYENVKNPRNLKIKGNVGKNPPWEKFWKYD